ncbi:MAG: tetratricopeptide repeat protein [Paludibacter sp.]|jgi:TolA-binding protein|nr:tetratricopeptide repeat protein [Paludibacter sp.]
MKRLNSIIFFALFAITAFAQQTLQYTNGDANFVQGKELYVQRQYSASYRCFEQYLSTANAVDAGQRQEAEFYLAANAFELKRDNAEQLLADYSAAHPYSPFDNQTNFMLGSLAFDSRSYRTALAYFRQVSQNVLDKRQNLDFRFRMGYCQIETADWQQAASTFSKLKNEDTRYKISATYYYAYAQYSLKKYGESLSDFLKVENTDLYRQIAPYYIIQIYYFQKKYDLVNSYAERLLKDNPKNPNNFEIYRILGEIAYEKEDYSKAIQQLKQYETLAPQQMRNDFYLLGMSSYKTKNYPDAIKYLSKTTTQKDEITENAYLHLGNSYIKIGDKTNASMAYEAALRTHFNPQVRQEALFNYALANYETNATFGTSVKAFNDFINEFPNSPKVEQAKNYMAEDFFTTKNYEEAYNTLQTIKNPNRRLVEARQYLLYQLGVQQFLNNNQTKAIANFTQAIDISSITSYAAESFYWRAESYARTGQNDLSLSDLKAFFANQNATKSTNYAAANYSIAYLFFHRKNYSEALNWFVKYVQVEKNKKANTYPDALNRAGDCSFNARNFTAAENYYSQAAAASPNTGDYAQFQLAYIEGLKNNYSQKISKLNQLLKTYPKSEYADDALYEIGRSYIMLDDDNHAIETYTRLVAEKPNSNLAPKASLEKGMIYYNQKQLDNAIATFKTVISNYSGSQEAYMALQSLEGIYIEKNDVAAYLAYTKTLNMKIGNNSLQYADSITYLAAEKQYINAAYSQAISGFITYLKTYCTGGRYCTLSQYYLADSYYRSGDKTNALVAFRSLLKTGSNQYVKEATTRCAEISYDQKDFAAALNYFAQLNAMAESQDETNTARLGILRCNYFLDDHQKSIDIASEIIADTKSTIDIQLEARYNRAKSYIALNKANNAVVDLQITASSSQNEQAAEAKYLLAQVFFDGGKSDDAETLVKDFAKTGTAYQYWLARSFVLLADIYSKRGDSFQAKQYLLSLQNNYKAQDDISEMITTRLQKIAESENKNIIN